MATATLNAGIPSQPIFSPSKRSPRLLANQLLCHWALNPDLLISRLAGRKSPRKLGCDQLLVKVISLLRPTGTTEKSPVPLKFSDSVMLRFCSAQLASGNGMWIPCARPSNPVPGSTASDVPLTCGACTTPIPRASPTPTTINGLPTLTLGWFKSRKRSALNSAFTEISLCQTWPS